MLDAETAPIDVPTATGALTVILVVSLYAAAVLRAFAGDVETAVLLVALSSSLGVVLLVWLLVRQGRSARTSFEALEREFRRPDVVRIVARGVDPVREWLAESARAWDVAKPPAGFPVYPELPPLSVSQDVVMDLAREHEDLVRSVVHYYGRHREYRSLWAELHADLTERIAGAYEPDWVPETVADAVPEAHADRPTEADLDPEVDPRTLLADQAGTFARYVLENPEPPADPDALSDRHYRLFLLDVIRRDLLGLRGEAAFGDRIDRLHGHLVAQKDDTPELRERLEAVRTDYVETYDLDARDLARASDGD